MRTEFDMSEQNSKLLNELLAEKFKIKNKLLSDLAQCEQKRIADCKAPVSQVTQSQNLKLTQCLLFFCFIPLFYYFFSSLAFSIVRKP